MCVCVCVCVRGQSDTSRRIIVRQTSLAFFFGHCLHDNRMSPYIHLARVSVFTVNMSECQEVGGQVKGTDYLFQERDLSR